MLHLPDKMGAEGWQALSKVADKGKVDSVSVDRLELGVEAEEIKTLCTVLGFAKQWRITSHLKLGDKMGAEGWEALSMVINKGKVGRVIVSKSALRAANIQQVEALWRATVLLWLDYSGRTIANKSEGAAGLRRLLALRGKQTLTFNSENCNSGQLHNRNIGDDALENCGKCCQLL